jgi:peptidoglycan/xylan/chitin deacetylase (PgdA/CDA1 family)
VLNLTVGRLDRAGYLTSPQVSRLAARGWELAAHTLTHPDLRRVPTRRLAREVAGSRAALERRFGLPVRFFCYPFGRSDARVRAAVRAAGFLAATSIRPGSAAPWDDPLTLRRIDIGPRTAPRALLRRITAAGRSALARKARR